MIYFLKSKSFLISTAIFCLLFVLNVAVTDLSAKQITLAILKAILAGIISGIVVGGIIYLVQKKKKRIN